jgi:4'-phosphopantetheinyl transferase
MTAGRHTTGVTMAAARERMKAIAPGHAVVYVASIRPSESADRLPMHLTADEQADAARYHFDDDRRRFAVGRSLVRELVGSYLGIPPGEVALTRTPFGKPQLAASTPRVHFNVSHSGDLVVAAFAAEAVGVDIERIRASLDLDAMADVCFSGPERAVIFGRPDGQAERFFRFWACKEAWIKADGRGLSLPLTDFTISERAPGRYGLAQRGAPLRFEIRVLPIADGYAAAVATATPLEEARIYVLI